MAIKTIIICSLILLFIYWFYWVLRMKNFFKFIIVVGKMGSGKTTLLTKQALKFKKKKTYLEYDNKIKKFVKHPIKIYSNSDIIGIDTIKFNPMELGDIFIPDKYSILFIDEASIFWSNRKFKSISDKTLTFMKQIRKYKCRIYLYSQSFNVDKVMRDLSQEMWLCKSFMITWSVSRKILKAPTIKENALERDSQLVDEIKFAPFWIYGNIQVTWIPKYIKYFDSFQVYNN